MSKTNKTGAANNLFAFDTTGQARGFALEVGVDAPAHDSCATVIEVPCKTDRAFNRISVIAAKWRQAAS